MERRTLGGSKKYLFEPKVPQNNEIDENLADKNKEIKKDTKKTPNTKKNAMKKKDASYNECIAALNVEKECTDKIFLDEINNNMINMEKEQEVHEEENVLFKDDFLYTFQLPSDFNSGKILVYEDGSCALKVEDEIYKMTGKEVSYQVVVDVAEDIREIGGISSSFIACKDIK